MACFLFHGPGAEIAALTKAREIGREVHSPLGLEGLKVDDARLAVSLLSFPAVGDKVGVLIIGPLDTANPKACDVLLKSIEEPGETVPLLWAYDYAEVPATIRSRCHPEWSLGEGDILPQETIDLAWNLVNAVVEGNVKDALKYLHEGKASLEDLARGISRCICEGAQDGYSEMLKLWEILRPHLGHPQLTYTGFASAVLKVLSDGVQ